MRLFSVFLLISWMLSTAAFCGDTVRPGLENIEAIRPGTEELALINALREPFLAGKDVSAAMQDWFDGRLLHSRGNYTDAVKKWTDGIGKLENLPQLPKPVFAPMPDGEFSFISNLKLSGHPGVEVRIVSWFSGELKQYGVIMYPKKRAEGARFPLMLYCHGAACGLPNSFMGRLGDLVEKGYVVAGPAMRGEPLFQMELYGEEDLKSQGEIENLDGEVEDCLSMVSAAWKLPFVRPGEFGVIGHSFGAGAGLLAAARAGGSARAVVSYDAWLVNPQRYCWDRMRRGPRNWDSWEDYCNQPVISQLEGLMKRSIIQNAEKIQCPLLLFMGGAYEGSVFHRSHRDFTGRLDELGKLYQYEVIPGGDHNFVLRHGRPALAAMKIQDEFLDKYYPPLKPELKK